MGAAASCSRFRHAGALLPAALLSALLLLHGSTAAGEGKAAPRTVDKLAGQVVLSPRPFPPSFPSDEAFLATMRRMKTGSFHAGARGGWDIHFLAFFPFALDELSCEVHVFDVTYKESEGQSTHVETITQFLAQRGQRTLASTLYLDPERYEKEHTYRLIVARRSDRGLLAEARFVLFGKR